MRNYMVALKVQLRYREKWNYSATILPKPAICWLRVTWTDSRRGSLLRIPIIGVFELFPRNDEEEKEETEPKETSTPNHTINLKYVF